MSKYLPYILLFSSNLIFAINFTAAKKVMPLYIEPMAFIGMRVVAAAFLFWIYSFLKPQEKIQKSDWWRLLACAIFGVALNQMLFFKGLDWTSPINASLIMTITPITVVIVSAILLREKVTFIQLFGIIMGCIGAIGVILYGKEIHFSVQSRWGDVLVLINAASYGLYLVIVKPLLKKYESTTVLKWIFLLGIPMVVPFGYEGFGVINWASLPMYIIGIIVYVLVFVTFLAYLFNGIALQKINSTVVSSYIYLQPILATIIAITFNNETISWQKLVAGLCIFVGVYLVSKPTIAKS